ncbi:MAG: hypothetical protein ACP5IX_01075, partial [Patescibacteria group bacterium]
STKAAYFRFFRFLLEIRNLELDIFECPTKGAHFIIRYWIKVLVKVCSFLDFEIFEDFKSYPQVGFDLWLKMVYNGNMWIKVGITYKNCG